MKIFFFLYGRSEAESKEKHGFGTQPELTISAPYVCSLSRLQHFTRATLCQCRLYPPVRDLAFDGLWRPRIFFKLRTMGVASLLGSLHSCSTGMIIYSSFPDSSSLHIFN